MTDIPPLPDNAKLVLPYILRAQELATRDPAISYWCKMHAARVALQCSSDIPALRTWLLQLMDHLEHDKQQLSDNPYVSDPIQAAAHLEDFALKIFTIADKDDRAGTASMRTAKTFLAASNYFDVLAVFSDTGDIDLDIKEKSKYAKWKATDIVKALKSGQQPHPGGPSGSDDHSSTSTIIPTSDPIVSSPVTHPHSSLPLSVCSPYPSSTVSTHSTTDLKSPQPSSTVSSSISSAIPKLIDPRITAQAQKFARFAISALEYDDITTAIDNLQNALSILAPFHSTSSSS